MRTDAEEEVPGFQPGAEDRDGEAYAEGRERLCPDAGTEDRAISAVPLEGRVSRGGFGRSPAESGPAAEERAGRGEGPRGGSRRACRGQAAGWRTRTQGRSTTGRSRFFSASLAASRGKSRSDRRSWLKAIYTVIEAMKPLPQGDRSIARMCSLAGISRAGYYRHWRASAPREEETVVRDAIQRIA